jgi:hypothetical protein
VLSLAEEEEGVSRGVGDAVQMVARAARTRAVIRIKVDILAAEFGRWRFVDRVADVDLKNE